MTILQTRRKSEKTKFTASIRGNVASGKMEIWIDSTDPARGTKIGTANIVNKGKVETTWHDISTTVDNVTGVHGFILQIHIR
ncbi:MAG: carbohydrate-binding protein [Bacteroidales bacterium]|nr:carbohydrate-binding protein [Bacteroidales bacterium]